MNPSERTLEYYRRKEQDVFLQIPGMRELLKSYDHPSVRLAEKYPDAAFALMTSGEILSGDRERNAISQQAYFEILGGKDIADVRSRYQKAMDRYLRDHGWDD